MGSLGESVKKVASTVLDPFVSVERNLIGDDLTKKLDPIGDSLAPDKGRVMNPTSSGAASAATPTTLLDPTQMPTLSGQRDAKRKAVATQLARKGRASTILSQDDTLGASG